MKFDKRAIAGLGASGALLVAAAYPAVAQTATETPSAGQEEVQEERAARDGEFAAALAEELGLDEETVAAAIETVRTEMAEARQAEQRTALEERLAAAVEEGTLTQEQADALLAAIDAGVLPGGFGGGGPGMHRGGGGPGRGFGPGGPGLLPGEEGTGQDGSEAPSEGTS